MNAFTLSLLSSLLPRSKDPSPKSMEAYLSHLTEAELASATLTKYTHDIKRFFTFAGNAEITKLLVKDYKEFLGTRYKPSSVNSMLSALNGFFAFCSRPDLRIKQIKVQASTYLAEEKELTKAEYKRLLEAAEATCDYRIKFIMQSLFATGMRVSEVQYLTAESVRRGQALVDCKGKKRTVYLPDNLRTTLRLYMQSQSISTGPLFVSASGAPLSRNYIWRAMKDLCGRAGVAAGKVFPHNLRHLFARCFYAIEKDLVKLANILGHASINTTRIYAQETEAAHRKVLNRMAMIYGGDEARQG